MLAKRRKHQRERGASFGIDRRAAARRNDCRAPASHDLLAAQHQACAAQDSEFPGAFPISRRLPARANVDGHSFNRRDKAPASGSERGDLPLVASPNSGWGGGDQITGPGRRCTGRTSLGRRLNRRRNQGVERLKRLIMRNLLLRLAGNF